MGMMTKWWQNVDADDVVPSHLAVAEHWVATDFVTIAIWDDDGISNGNDDDMVMVMTWCYGDDVV